MLFQRWCTPISKMNKEQFLHYFFKKYKNTEKAEEIKVAKVTFSATKEITNPELRFAVNEIDKSHSRPKKYQKEIPKKVKREDGNHSLTFGTSSAIKKFSVKYPKFTFIRTSVNNWTNKCETGGDNFVFKKVGRPNLLDDKLIKKNKDIAKETRQPGGVINRRQIVNITKGVVRANNPDILKEFGGTISLINRWVKSVLPDLNWSK